MSAIGGTAAEESGTVPAILPDDRVPLAAWMIAAAYVVVELAVSDRYGFQQDELYFLVASRHLAFGYVDQPPLAVLLARTTDLFGVNPPPSGSCRRWPAARSSCSRRGSPHWSTGAAARG